MRVAGLLIAAFTAVPLTAAHAALPEPVRAMIEEAIASGDPQTVSTVPDVARKTNSDDAQEFDALLAALDLD